MEFRCINSKEWILIPYFGILTPNFGIFSMDFFAVKFREKLHFLELSANFWNILYGVFCCEICEKTPFFGKWSMEFFAGKFLHFLESSWIACFRFFSNKWVVFWFFLPFPHLMIRSKKCESARAAKLCRREKKALVKVPIWWEKRERERVGKR